MRTMTLKGVPAAVYEKLRRRAAMHRRSMNQEAITCLERELGAGPLDVEAFIEEVDKMRARLKGPPLTEKWLKKAKSEGRP